MQTHVREHYQEQQMHLLFCLPVLSECADPLSRSQVEVLDLLLSILLLEYERDQHEGRKGRDTSG